MNCKSLKIITNLVRNASSKPTTNGTIQPFLHNRNPRNLERLRLERKPTGYCLETFNVEFWHKLVLTPYRKHVVAQLIHNTEKVVVEASTNEWAIYKQLYSKVDKLAYITLAKVFAERCLESGLYSFATDIKPNSEDSKDQLFLKTLEEEGLTLSEADYFDIHDIYRRKREKRPWTVLEDQ